MDVYMSVGDPDPAKDLDVDEWFARAKEWAEHGFHVHQKFFCQACGSRQTVAEANKFYTKGTCERCGATTDIVKAGFLSARSVDRITGDAGYCACFHDLEPKQVTEFLLVDSQ